MTECAVKEYTVTSKQIENMKHAIGFDNAHVKGRIHRKYTAYRNHYTTYGDHEGWDLLVQQGLATKRDFPQGGYAESKIYHVSDEGLAFLSATLNVTVAEGR